MQWGKPQPTSPKIAPIMVLNLFIIYQILETKHKVNNSLNIGTITINFIYSY